jgi:ribonuclease P protein component
MPAAPEAASASPPEPATGGGARACLPPARRLLRPDEFFAVISDPKALRLGSRWLSLVAGRVQPRPRNVPVRFGFTASKRQARRAIDRNTVRRVLKESARRHLAILDAAAADRPVDIVLRLKAPAAEAARRTPRTWKAALRAEADALLLKLADRLGSDAGRNP